LSLRASQLAAACRLCQSGRRARGPVNLPRSGCPVCRSQHPAAFAQSLLPPLPAAFCARVQRLCRSPRPQNAVPYSSVNLTIPINQDPSPPDCLILRSTSDQSKRCALTRTLVSCHPWSLSPLKGRARCLFLRRAARARRAPAKGRMGRSPYPLCRARSLPPPQPIAEHVGPLPPGVPNPNRVPRRQAFEEPRWPRCCHRTRGLRRLAHAGVVPLTLQATLTLGSSRSHCRQRARNSVEVPFLIQRLPAPEPPCPSLPECASLLASGRLSGRTRRPKG